MAIIQKSDNTTRALNLQQHDGSFSIDVNLGIEYDESTNKYRIYTSYVRYKSTVGNYTTVFKIKHNGSVVKEVNNVGTINDTNWHTVSVSLNSTYVPNNSNSASLSVTNITFSSFKYNEAVNYNGVVTVYINTLVPYKVHYDLNGGKGSIDDIIENPFTNTSKTITLNSNLDSTTLKNITKDGYELAGWIDDTSKEIKSNSALITSITCTRSNPEQTAYAVWKPIITYNRNKSGYTGIYNERTEVKWPDQKITLTNPSYWNWTSSDDIFRGWSERSSSSSSIVEYYEGRDTKKFYAIWVAYKLITFDSNGGYSGTYTIKADPDSYVIIPPEVGRSYYTFKAWGSSSSGGTLYYPSASIKASSLPSTLYAIWTPIKYSVVFDANGGTNPPNPIQFEGDATPKLPTAIPSKAGFSFSAWNTKSDGSGTSYNPGGTWSQRGNGTLYAIWTPGIFYDANGGYNAPDIQFITSTNDITLRTNIPIRDGYTFLHWNTARNDTGTSYNPGATYTPVNDKDNVYLYAIWRKDPDNPTISSILCTRINSSGSLDDLGTRLKITVTWNVDTVLRSGNTGRCNIAIKKSSASSWTDMGTSSYADSATTTKTVSNISTDEQYDIRVTVTDLDDRVTTRYDILTRSKFVWDVKAGGEAMGIGSAAPSSGLEIGWATQFDESVRLLKTLAVTGDVSITGEFYANKLNTGTSQVTTGIVEGNSYFTISGQVAHIFAKKLCSLSLTITPSRSYAIGEINSLIGTIASGYRPISAQSFGTLYGIGYIRTDGRIYFTNLVSVSDSTPIVIGLVYLLS